jgi:hypothetical protein
MDGERDANDLAGLAQARGIANDQRTAALEKVGVGQALHDDFGSDPGGIAHRNRNNWT